MTVLVEKNVAVPMRDGVVLRADVYRPQAPGRHPVLLQRPIVVKGRRAAIGRPPEAVLPLLK